jgi:hypothetical protein
MSTLKNTIDLRIKGSYTTARDLESPVSQYDILFRHVLSSGTGLDQGDLLWSDERILSATSENIDLAGGGLSDGLGSALAFVKVKGIYIRNMATTAGYNLLVGGAATNAFINWVGDATDIVNVGPGGALLLYNPSAAGYAVTAATGDILKIDSGANAITYRIVIIGTSA